MNKQQRLLLIGLIAIAVILLVAIIAVNLSKRPAAVAGTPGAATEAPQDVADDPLAGLTEAEIEALAMQEEHGDDYVSAFDEDGGVTEPTADPNATAEPID